MAILLFVHLTRHSSTASEQSRHRLPDGIRRDLGSHAARGEAGAGHASSRCGMGGKWPDRDALTALAASAVGLLEHAGAWRSAALAPTLHKIRRRSFCKIAAHMWCRSWRVSPLERIWRIIGCAFCSRAPKDPDPDAGPS